MNISPVNNIFCRKDNSFALKPCSKKHTEASYAVSGDNIINETNCSNPLKTAFYPSSYYVSFGKTLQTDENKTNNGNLDENCFFIRMKHYDKNPIWAYNMLNATKTASKSIKAKESFSNVIKKIESDVSDINHNCLYGARRKEGSYYKTGSFLLIKRARGEEYLDKYLSKIGKDVYSPNSKNMFKDGVNHVIIKYSDDIEGYIVRYPTVKNYYASNLDKAQKIYDELIGTKEPSARKVVESAAKIQWLIAQETPYIKGSDSVANILTKAIISAYDLPLAPIKEGISLDFEAWGQDMDEYIENYPYYFEVNPTEESGEN